MWLARKDGSEIIVGDTVRMSDGQEMVIRRITKPHKPSSTGRVSVSPRETHWEEYFPSVFNLKWMDREDQ